MVSLDTLMVTLPRWLEYVENQIGFVLPVNQHSWLESAIYQTAIKYKIETSELWEQIQSDASVRQDFLDAVLILESRFFRHPPSMKFITQLAIQKKLKSQRLVSDSSVSSLATESLVTNKLATKKRVTENATNHQSNSNHSNLNHRDEFRVWSMGCSEGQEVWSIAMCLALAGVTNFHITGTDVSTKAISTAKRAIYENSSRLEIPISYQKFVRPLSINEKPIDNQLIAKKLTDKKQQQKYWQVDKSLHKHVLFVSSNAFLDSSSDIPSAHLLIKQDVIICQNMLIYFRKFDQRDILAKMVDRCAIGGHIILAPGEALFWQHPQMQRVDNDQINAWQKVK